MVEHLSRSEAFHSCTSLLVGGRALTIGRHTITTYGCLTGAAVVNHFSRVYVFLLKEIQTFQRRLPYRTRS